MFRKLLTVNENINAWYDRMPEPRRMISMIVVLIILMTGSYFIFARGDDMMAVGLIWCVVGFSRLAHFLYEPHKTLAINIGSLFHFNVKERVLKKGPFKGRTLVMGSDTRLTAHGDLIPEFMHEILGIDAFLITDESSLYDFLDADVNDTKYMWANITHVYGITREEVNSDCIVDILDAISLSGKPH